MSEKNMPFGTIKENNGMVIMEIPLSKANITETIQLEELKRDHSFFFPCQHYIEENGYLYIYYKRNEGYQPVASVADLNHDTIYQIALNILQAEKIIGTQYTTSFAPENIYVNSEGSVQFAHRGIRSILPPKALSGGEFLLEMKRFLIYLYTGRPFSGIRSDNDETESPLINNIWGASTVGELKQIIEDNHFSHENADEQHDQHKSENMGPPVQSYTGGPLHPSDDVNQPEQRTSEVSEANEEKKKSTSGNRRTTLVILLLGFLCGLIFLYVIQAIPLGKENDKLTSVYKEAETKKESLQDKNEKLHQELDYHEEIEKAYRYAYEDENEKAIETFEKMKELDEETEETLIDLYINANSAESLEKASEMDEGLQADIVEKLVSLNSDEANEVIKNMDSPDPKVLLEKAWLSDDYREVTELHEDDLTDNTRAKKLAAKSYIELEKPKEAKKLGEDLDNKDIQINSLKKEIDLVEDDDDMDKDDRKDEKEDLEDEIDDLED